MYKNPPHILPSGNLPHGNTAVGTGAFGYLGTLYGRGGVGPPISPPPAPQAFAPTPRA